MGAVDYSVWIKASPEQVWRVYVDPSRIPEWQTGSPVIEEVHGSADQPAAATSHGGAQVPRALLSRRPTSPAS